MALFIKTISTCDVNSHQITSNSCNTLISTAGDSSSELLICYFLKYTIPTQIFKINKCLFLFDSSFKTIF